MALHIARIEVENFRNFGHLTVDPFPATAVIVGENNVGKTNLLYALRLILDPDLGDSARRLRPEDFFDGSGGISSGVTIRIAIELADFANDTAACAALSDALISEDPPRARLEFRYEPREPVPSPADPSQGDGEAMGGQDGVVNSLTPDDYDWSLVGGPADNPRVVRAEPRRFIGLQVLPALRDASDELTRRRSPLRDLLDRTTPAKTILDAAAADVNKAMEDLLADPSVGSLQTNIRDQTVSMVGPAMQVRPTLGIAPTVPDQLLRQIRLFTDDDRKRGLSGTSVGTANVLYLALLLEAVRRRRTSKDNVATVLGVEEPEAHLHVQVQRRLFGYLLRTEPALLLTSHSPHIAAVAPLASLVLLRSADTGSTATTSFHAGLTEQQAADLERYIDATRAELLFARVVLLVEGDAERYIVPAIANAAGFDLDEYGVSVVSVQGTDFQPFVRLLGHNGLAIDSFVLTDGDRNVDFRPATSAGLSRSLRLIDSDAARELLQVFPAHPRRDGHKSITDDQHERMRELLSASRIFPGDTTLEVDLARSVPDAFSLAIADFLGEDALEAQETCLEAISSRTDNEDTRKEFVGRIEAVGKGRFAQRLASYLVKADVKTIAQNAQGDDTSAVLFKALSQISKLVRGCDLWVDPVGGGEGAGR